MTDTNDKRRKGKNLPTRTKGGKWSKLKPRARQMRKVPTIPEEILWERFRRKQVARFKFRRQHPIANFIVDFYCADARLVIEVDGSIHDEDEQMEYDEGRQKYLEDLGIEVMRFPNGDVMKKTDSVITQIEKFLKGRNSNSCDLL